ncbi:hypothetical protein V6N00_13775 [Tersicoccus sp. MR15.9]|uniref:hypothetical protein n=1 Tax=Tersicoccus mangrovi TaxID=3121635 RepID=UPI002FE59027
MSIAPTLNHPATRHKLTRLATAHAGLLADAASFTTLGPYVRVSLTLLGTAIRAVQPTATLLVIDQTVTPNKITVLDAYGEELWLDPEEPIGGLTPSIDALVLGLHRDTTTWGSGVVLSADETATVVDLVAASQLIR